MTKRTVKVTIAAVSIAFYIAVEHYFLSGTYPGFVNALRIIILLLFAYGVYQVIKEPIRKLKIIQITILLLVIILGFIGAITISKTLENDFPRRYYINKVQ